MQTRSAKPDPSSAAQDPALSRWRTAGRAVMAANRLGRGNIAAAPDPPMCVERGTSGLRAGWDRHIDPHTSWVGDVVHQIQHGIDEIRHTFGLRKT